MAKILNGKRLSQILGSRLINKVKKLKTKPVLVIIQIGDLAESNTYIKNKKAFAETIGAKTIHKRYPNSVREETVIADIKRYNADKSIHGIMIQLPGPIKFNMERVLETIDPRKDVDGLTSLNAKHLLDNSGSKAFIPATAKGVITLLDASKIKILGAKVAMVGQSPLVGRPIMLALLNRGATVTVCHKDTKNMEKETRSADILVTAVGKPRLITKRHVSRNQIVIDIGISVLKNGKISGDVDFEPVSKVVRAITPVPGGVGPMTVASLLENLLDAYALQSKQ